MTESINQRTGAMPTGGPELQKLLTAMLADITSIRTNLVSLAAQLDADTVSGLDDDYEANNTPDALTTIS